MSISLLKSDFEEIGQVAVHCNLVRLNLATKEAAEFDLKPYLCDLYYEVEDAWDGDGSDEALEDLINGAEFENCAGNQVSHKGLRKMLAYYAYARYKILQGTEDTATGTVQKQRGFSIPISEKELSGQASRYTSMGYAVWLEIRNFLCLKGSDVYPKYNFLDCPADCSCGGGCGRPGVGRTRMRIRNIKRK